MHAMLLDCATSETGQGEPVKVVLNHKCNDIDLETGTITFDNGVVAEMLGICAF